jgi:hypothetical protein
MESTVTVKTTTTNTMSRLGRLDLHEAFAEIIEELTSRHSLVPPMALDICRMIRADKRVSSDILPNHLERDIEGLDEAGPLATYGQGAKRVAAMLEREGRSHK